jgi:hypothetical protein
MARVEKQREKAAKRLQRKNGDHSTGPEILTLEEAAALRSS